MKFIFDLDGTICFDGINIPEKIKEALRQAPTYNHEIIFASARSYRDCLPVIGEEFSDNLVIGLNGGVSYKDRKVVFSKAISHESYTYIVEKCRELNLPFFVDDKFNYSHFKGEELSFFNFVDPLKLAKNVPIFELKKPIKIVISLAERLEIKNTLLNDFKKFIDLEIMFHEREHCLYINPKSTTKASTILHLIGEDYICFGNDKNDIEMFEHSKYSVQIGSYEPLTSLSNKQILLNETYEKDISKEIYRLYKKYK